MLKQKKFPTVLFHDGATYTDLSLKMLSFGRDSSVVPLLSAMGALYFGRFKPFSAIYAEMKVVNAVAATLTVEYWNGTAWTALESVVDDTNAFARSGFIQFDKPEDWEATTVNSLEAHFIRIRPSQNVTPTMELQGINIVFSDDQDLRGVYPSILNFLDSSETSFILRHENARDRVVEQIRKIDRKSSAGSGKYEAYDAWDFLHVEEVRLWALYLALENIFSGLQSREDDLYIKKAEEYRKAAEFHKNTVFLTLDSNNDGKDTAVKEQAQISSRRLVRG